MSDSPPTSYRPIRDYALIGNGQTAALVAPDGSIDWCCWPRFDSPAVFCRLLDARRGGWFRMGPAGPYRSSRAYVEGTNLLATTFATADGEVRVTDLMSAPSEADGRNVFPHRILRKIEGLAGRVELEIGFRPTFDYARAGAHLAPCPRGAVARSGEEALSLVCPVPLRPESDALVGRWTVAAGERGRVTVTHGPARDAEQRLALSDADAEAEFDRTLHYWKRWSEAYTYDGPYRDLVLRSALALKLLFFQPTGALVAAPTTSLPEEIGGVRNWDYRFTWLRDSALILDALMQIGYHDESLRFFKWLETLCVCCRGDLRIMYTVDGSPLLPERILDHLEGYRGSRPVRIGNAAADQTQLDVYGHVLDAVFLCMRRMPRAVRPQLWDLLRLLADRAAARWGEPDRGPWEVRGEPRHFLYSKLYCWVALDRAVRLAEQAGLPGNVATWRREREALRRAILTRGYSDRIGAFTQAFDHPALDASALVLPLVEFLPATDARLRSTVRAIQERLVADGLVYRYLADDGLPGGEATFALCSFWLVDNLAKSGRVGEARDLFERVCGYANDVGLLAEEIEPSSGELLGNFPQGFAHLGLIRAALHIAHADADAAGASDRSATELRSRAGRSDRWCL